MKMFKFLLPVAVAVCGFGVSQAAQDGFATEKEARQRDFEALRDYIKTKRAISVKDKGGNLMISGDIRTEYYFMHARNRHTSQRGWASRKLYPNSYINKVVPKISHREYKHKTYKERVAYRIGRSQIKPPYQTSEFDLEANLIFDYIGDRGWGTAQMQMQNPMGLIENERKALINDSRKIMYGSGKNDKFTLRKAFAGYNVWEEGTSRFDLEIGRRRFYDVFDSDVQFYSYFDGLLARFSNSFEGVTDLSFKAAAFVVDQTVNHWGYVGELGLLNLGDSGFDLKYSLIHWDKHSANRFGQRHPLGVQFINSQFLAGYTVSPDVVSMKTYIYGAFLTNHDAKRTHLTHGKKANDAWYVGVKLGEVLRKGDYALGFGYQWVQAQAVPERDVSGIYRDNPRGISFYNRKSGGFANFRGWRVEGIYALTDNWTLNSHFDRVRELDDHIGGKHRSYEFYLAAIFAF